MGTFKKPLKRSILIAMILFITTLCLVLSVMQYAVNRRTLYRKYEDYIQNILSYTAAGIDVDDLAQCIRTGEESAKYRALQGFLDRIRASVDLHFLYVIIPLNTNETDNIQNVIAAVSDYEYENEADQLVHLNMLAGDSYSPATAKKYLDAYNSGQLSFFEEISEWGDDYTGLLPLYDSRGNRVAALCMDVDIREIHTALRTSTLGTLGIIVLLGTLFAIAFFVWTEANITYPIGKLENSVVHFAQNSHQQRNPDALVLEMPDIHTGNEVESLAKAVVKMSEDMRDYVNSIVDTEKELARMDVIAHRDALTHVNNKAAFDRYTGGMNDRLGKDLTAFSMLMMDVNYLKQINDRYGHEKGDVYLKGSCKILCDVFGHSPVFRVGGDEFAAVLEGADYVDRGSLLNAARRRFSAAKTDESAEPWLRFSVALGIADYRPGVDRCVDDVLARADSAMYSEKSRMKSARA